MTDELQGGDAYRQGLRDSLLAAVDTVRDEPNGEEQADGVSPAPDVPAAVEGAPRARDESGKFVKSEAPPAKVEPAPAASPAPAIPASTALQPPSSWKKEFHEAFGKLSPDVANYIRQRETEYNTGVSTYRAEAEKAKVLHSALEPFLPAMQQHNVQPADWIRSVGQTHEILLKGSPQQKFATIVGLARDYGVDLSPLTGGQAQPQGDAGQPQQSAQAQLNPEVAWLRDQVSTLSQQVNSFTQQRQQDQQSSINSEIQKFAADTTKYPHFEALREPMARLLESGLAQDLSSAYDKALRMNDELWQSQQESQRQQAEAEKQRQATAQAAQARAKVVSVKSATPSATPAAANTATDRRSQLADAFSQHSGGGRV
jgi:molecular chaperone GrpE (heat shock protein)